MTGDQVLSFESPLAALVVASAEGGFADDGFARLDAALREDRLGSDDHLLLPLLEPCLRSHVPDWDYLPIAGGLRRRSRLETAMAGQLAEAVQQQLHIRGVNAVLIGDLAAARDAGLTQADIVETVGNVVANIFTNYLNHVAGTDIDFPARKARAA